MLANPAGGGTTTPTPGPHDYADGAVVSISAAPNTNWTFTPWSGDLDCNDGSVTMNADVSCTANFNEVPPVSLYLSVGSNTNVNGLAIANDDILAFDESDFSMFFDGSDVGVSDFRINAFAIMSATEILMSFDQSGSVPGISGTVDDSDIVKFTATTLGGTTAGSFELYFDGSDAGLTTSSEDVDALKLLDNGHLLISTRGSFSVPGLSGSDEDILELTPSSLGSTTSGI